jgi:SAM-dependent methyltransferase
VSSPSADDRRAWGGVAAAWDRHRERLFETTRAVSERLVDVVDPGPGDVVLELGAGPGETGFLAAERVGTQGRLISTDAMPEMVEAARRGAESRGIANVEFRVLDAAAVDLADASVDAVISRFAVMLTPEPARVVREALRVLRPGRRFAYGVWGAMDQNPWMTALGMAMLTTGHLPPGPGPFDPGGVFSLADPAANRALMEAAGFIDVRVEEISGEMHYDTFDDYFTLQSEVSGPVAIAIDSLTDADLAAVRDAAQEQLEPHRVGDGYRTPWTAVVTSAAST